MRNMKLTGSSGRFHLAAACSLLLVSVIACGGDKPNNTNSSSNSNATAPEPFRVSASTLHGYENCPHWLIAVNGMVASINTSGNGGSVDLVGKASETTTFEGKPLAEVLVTCSFQESQKASLATLKKGQPVTIQGECDGKSLGAFKLKNCVVK